jgi:S-adenosyl methyltransferase
VLPRDEATVATRWGNRREQRLPPSLDLERPNAAQVYDWLLGGTTNWAVDRVFGERAVRHFPSSRG